MPRDSRLEALEIRRVGDCHDLDLSSVSWLDPLHLVACAAFAHHAQQHGSWLNVRGLNRQNARYAARMRLGHAIEAHGGRCELPEVDAHDRSDSLLEVHKVSTASDAARWAQLVHERVHHLDHDVAHALHAGLEEVGENIAVHSQTYGFVAAQLVPSRAIIRFAVADAGVGLLNTLRGSGATSDKHALTLALAGKSRLGGTHGMGLSETWTNIARLGGSIVLASGGSGIHRAVTDKVRDTYSPASFDGTLFEGCVPATEVVNNRGPTLYGTRRRADDLRHRRRANL